MSERSPSLKVICTPVSDKFQEFIPVQEATTAQNNRKTAELQIAVLQTSEEMFVRGIQKRNLE